MSSRASSTAAPPSSSSARSSAIWRARSMFDLPEAPHTHPTPTATSRARPIPRMSLVVAMSKFLYSDGNVRGMSAHVPFETSIRLPGNAPDRSMTFDGSQKGAAAVGSVPGAACPHAAELAGTTFSIHRASSVEGRHDASYRPRGAHHTAAAHKLDEQQPERKNQQDVNERPNRVAAHRAEQP